MDSNSQTSASPEADQSSRLWKFANSNFGVFLFSVVLVGLLTFGWSEYRDWKKHKLDRERQVSRLKTEIQARVERCFHLMQADWSAPTGVPLERRLQQTGIAGPPSGVVVFPEFRERPLTSLFWEIRKLDPADTDYYAAAQGVAELVELRLWERSEPGTPNLPADDEYAFHLAMLTILRSEENRRMDAAMQKLEQEFPGPTPEEREQYIRERWPGYAELMQQFERENAAERLRKEKLLKDKSDEK